MSRKQERFQAMIERGPHREGKPDRWAVFERCAFFWTRRSVHESKEAAQAEAKRRNEEKGK